MKPSLEQLKAARDVLGQIHSPNHHGDWCIDNTITTLDRQIAEEEREAKAKEWPQEGDACWCIDTTGSIGKFGWTNQQGWSTNLFAIGQVFRTREDCQLVDDFLRSRPRGWLLAMAKMGEALSVMAFTALGENAVDIVTRADTGKWNALTEDERAALLGHG